MVYVFCAFTSGKSMFVFFDFLYKKHLPVVFLFLAFQVANLFSRLLDQTDLHRSEPNSFNILHSEQSYNQIKSTRKRRRVDIEVPNDSLNRISYKELACYPRSSYYRNTLKKVVNPESISVTDVVKAAVNIEIQHTLVGC